MLLSEDSGSLRFQTINPFVLSEPRILFFVRMNVVYYIL